MPSTVLGLAHFLPGSSVSVSTVSDAMDKLYAVFLRLGVKLSSTLDSRMPGQMLVWESHSIKEQKNIFRIWGYRCAPQ